jgi:hypothetical protein
MNYKLITNIDFQDVDHKDAPDYSDANICYAEYDGEPMTRDELDKLNEDGDFVHEALQDHLN